jgi:ubiquinone/menaquinone biosynthesis C-methylase UbiE
MAAHYDTYDYPNYWIGRDYEHGSELIALKEFLAKISKIGTIVEVGAGFGRLTPTYFYRAKKTILTDPSAKLLKIAREEFADKNNVHILQAGIEALEGKIRGGSADLVIMVRVLHHITDLDQALSTVNRILKPNGYFILEFPNKMHLKATLRQLFRGNLTFRFDISTSDKRSAKAKKQKKISFLNYHPDMIFEKLHEHGFEIIQKRSVSNIRSSLIKNILPCNFLLALEEALQIPFAYINFGPSVFVLAKKKG